MMRREQWMWLSVTCGTIWTRQMATFRCFNVGHTGPADWHSARHCIANRPSVTHILHQDSETMSCVIKFYCLQLATEKLWIMRRSDVEHFADRRFGYISIERMLRPSVCLSSVYLLRRLKLSAIFLWHLVPWPSVDIHRKFYGDRPRGTHPPGELNTRRLAKYSDFGLIEGYISEKVQYMR